MKGFLTGNEQRKEKREKSVEGEMWHTRVANRLKDKEGAGKTEKHRSRGQNKGFFLVDDKKRVTRVEKSVGKDTKTNPRKGMRNQRDTGDTKETKQALSKTKGKRRILRIRGGFCSSPKKKEEKTT